MGDRLSSVSSGPIDSTSFDPTPPDLRQQLYTTTLELERVQHAKSEALARVAQLEDRVLGLESRSMPSTSTAFSAPRQHGEPSPFKPMLPSSLFDPTPGMHNDDHAASMPAWGSTTGSSSLDHSLPSEFDPMAHSTSPYALQNPLFNSESSTEVDPTRHRMKAWGFPAPPTQKTPSPSKDHRRESFFGLSAAITPHVELEEFGFGVDLPPISSDHQVPSSPPDGTFHNLRPPYMMPSHPAVKLDAEPGGQTAITPKPTPTPLEPLGKSLEPHSEFRNPAPALLPGQDTVRKGSMERNNSNSFSPIDPLYERFEPQHDIFDAAEITHDRHDLDFTLVCRCCVGEVYVV